MVKSVRVDRAQQAAHPADASQSSAFSGHLTVLDRPAPLPLRAAQTRSPSTLLSHGANIVIHCRGGIGRAGMVAAVGRKWPAHLASRSIRVARRRKPMTGCLGLLLKSHFNTTAAIASIELQLQARTLMGGDGLV
jgi:hypothetical protein